MFIATLIADRLSSGDISAARDALAAASVATQGHEWVEQGKACDLLLPQSASGARRALEGAVDGADVVVQPREGRRRLLLAADMDSTMIDVECIDELADYAGLKAQVAEVTERAMRGEIAFEEALSARVALLEGLEEAIIDRCHDERVRITPGAKTLVATMRREGAHCLLVSGGFTRFADRVGREIGFNAVVANRLVVEGGRLRGLVEGKVVGAEAKREALAAAARDQGVPLDQTMAIGDGANDVPMLKAAGLGIAYRAKPAAVAAAGARIDHGDLSVLLYAQGFPRSDWEEV